MAQQARAARVLGRSHAALGQPALSASALDDALKLTKGGEHLLSESLTVKARAQLSKMLLSGGGGSTTAGQGQWGDDEGKERLMEVMGRMGGDDRGPLERLLLGGTTGAARGHSRT